ncbi:MAG: TetR/AcrR family transcriptional regulator [Burkholderiaceae bacterium]|nr:MAG: TetR/AcrR family transcriptional regulator [Burkholderiaceae bacterium]
MRPSSESSIAVKTAKPARAPKTKGEQTRMAILDCALEIAGREGLEGLTIGALAERMRMSKSGVISHFGSRESLQIAVLREYQRRFIEQIFLPSLQRPRGLPRLEAMIQGWQGQVSDRLKEGCLFVSGAVEYDDRPGSVRDVLVEVVRAWQQELLRAARQAVEEGHLRADTDPDQLVFELYGVILASHHERRLMGSDHSDERVGKSFKRLIDSYRANQQPGMTKAA